MTGGELSQAGAVLGVILAGVIVRAELRAGDRRRARIERFGPDPRGPAVWLGAIGRAPAGWRGALGHWWVWAIGFGLAYLVVWFGGPLLGV